MSEKMQEASEATEAAIQQNGLEDAASISSSSSGEEVQPPSYDTKGDEERSIDEAKEALLKVIIPLKILKWTVSSLSLNHRNYVPIWRKPRMKRKPQRLINNTSFSPIKVVTNSRHFVTFGVAIRNEERTCLKTCNFFYYFTNKIIFKHDISLILFLEY